MGSNETTSIKILRNKTLVIEWGVLADVVSMENIKTKVYSPTSLPPPPLPARARPLIYV